MIFPIGVTYSKCGTVYIEADSLEEAYDKIHDMNTPLPAVEYYLEDSIEASYPIEEYDELFPRK